MTKYVLMLAAALMVSINTNASANFEIDDLRKEKVFIVSMSNFKSEVEISIINSKGEILYKSFHQNSSKKAKAFDVKQLPNGLYKLIVKDGFQTKKTPFVVSYKHVEIHEEQSVVNFTPSIQQRGEKVFLNANIGEDSEISIVISDEDNNRVFYAEYEVEKPFGKVLNLEELPKGDYMVKVFVDESLYTKEVSLK